MLIRALWIGWQLHLELLGVKMRPANVASVKF